MKTFTKITISIISIFIIYLGISYISISRNTRAITKITSYKKVLNKRWHDPNLIKHFPKSIPQDATEKKFFFQPGFLQGGSTIELMIKMPKEFIKKETEIYQKNAKLIFVGDQKIDRSAGNPDSLEKWRFATFPEKEIKSENSRALLPSDFQIYLLYSKPYKIDPISWNHGQCFGISISVERNEIIYWANDW